ncbi:MAG: hypothetical protein HYX60_02785 [Legionella longbeachae]|nr:hypothetical protein [Legionella longbeachae]
MSAAKNLDKASGLFFFGGFLLSKFQYISFPLLSAIFRFVSLGMSMLAYCLLFASNLLHPDQKVRNDKCWIYWGIS